METYGFIYRALFVLLCGSTAILMLLDLRKMFIIQSLNMSPTKRLKPRCKPNSSTRTNVLILSQGRGGSSFLGELFNNNPNIMYVFEPLFMVGTYFNVNVYYEKEPENYGVYCKRTLENFFKCNFSEISEVLPKMPPNFRHRSNALVGDLLCNSSKKSLKALKKCVPLTQGSLAKACNTYKHTVVKILSPRLPNKTIDSLRDQLGNASGYDVKVINLIRDPRAVVYSWVSLGWIKDQNHPEFRLEVHRICEPIEKNIRLGLHPPAWLQNRFKIIRYEDLVLNTRNLARQLYSFAGFDWSQQVETWIIEHQQKPRKREENDPYSVHKNSTAAVNKWKEAPEKLIRIVEEICSDVMYLMNYKRWKKHTGEESNALHKKETNQ